MSAKNRSGPPVLDLLGGREWLRAVGLKADLFAPVPIGAVALACESTDAPRPNRAVVFTLEKAAGYRVEYWRVDGEDGESVGDKTVASAAALVKELVRAFGLILEPAVAA